MSLASPSPVVGYNQRELSSGREKKMNLPRIEHPSKRMNDDEKDSLDIRGRSTDGNRNGKGKLIRNEYFSPRRTRRSSSFKTNSKSFNYSEQLHDIPENVETISGEDREQVRLPIFGRRSESSTSSSFTDNSREIETPRTSRIIVDELERTLREKVRCQLHDVRAKFRHAAQNNSNGKLNRQALQHLIATIFGTQRQIGPNEMERLFQRLNLKQKNEISFDQFLQSLSNTEEQIPDWISHQSEARYQSSGNKTATQIFLILKEKVRTRNEDLISLVPVLNGGSSSRIFKAQLHNAIINMGYRMKDNEFDKLWDKFDTDGFKAIHSHKFLKILTNESIGEESISLTNRDDQSSSPQSTNLHSSPTDRESKTSRDQLDENQIENWLNHKFPRGFSDLENALERLDPKQTGILPRDRFLQELKRFGLKLESPLLEFFLKRLNVDLSLTNDGVPYLQVINAFKTKSDPTKKRINTKNSFPTEQTRQTALEQQIDLALSINYERVRDLFYRLDLSRTGTINGNELRAIIEDLIEYTLKADEYYQLLQRIPMNEHGRVKYKEYLKQVLDRSLHSQEQQHKSLKNPKYEFVPTTNIRERILPKQRREDKSNDLDQSSIFNDEKEETPRSIDQLREMLKILVRTRSKDIENEFKQIDRGSYGELTPSLLFQLFKRLSLQPAVTRDEVDLIWSRCHLKRDGNLDFSQFLREFGYSKGSAHYPNAKRNPPKKGDADLILTSNRFYGDSVLVHGTVLNIIRSKWNELRREFTQLDPYRTAYVQSEEFDQILTELCPSVNEDDLDMLKHRFQSNNDSRINYVRFLKHHAPIAELIGLVDEQQKKTLPTISDKSPRMTSDRSVLIELSNKLRRKFSHSSKSLRRTFKERDPTNTGSVSIQIFQEILNQHKCSLNDEQFYTLISQLDQKMDGNINYNHFIQQYITNT